MEPTSKAETFLDERRKKNLIHNHGPQQKIVEDETHVGPDLANVYEKTMNSIRAMFNKTKFEKIKDTDITQEVIQALDEISEQKKSRIQKGTGKIIRRSFETFAGVKGTPIYEAFVKGDIGYYRCLLKK